MTESLLIPLRNKKHQQIEKKNGKNSNGEKNVKKEVKLMGLSKKEEKPIEKRRKSCSSRKEMKKKKHPPTKGMVGIKKPFYYYHFTFFFSSSTSFLIHIAWTVFKRKRNEYKKWN